MGEVPDGGFEWLGNSRIGSHGWPGDHWRWVYWWVLDVRVDGGWVWLGVWMHVGLGWLGLRPDLWILRRIGVLLDWLGEVLILKLGIIKY